MSDPVVEGRRSGPPPLNAGRHLLAFLVLASPGLLLVGVGLAAAWWPFPGSVAVSFLAWAVAACLVIIAALFSLGQAMSAPPVLRSFRCVDGVLFYRMGEDEEPPCIVRLADLFRVDDLAVGDFGLAGWMILCKDGKHLVVTRSTTNGDRLAQYLRSGLARLPGDGTAIEGVLLPWPIFTAWWTLAGYAALLLAILGPVGGSLLGLIVFGPQLIGPTASLVAALTTIVVLNLAIIAVCHSHTRHRGQWVSSFLYAGCRLYYRLIEGTPGARSADEVEAIRAKRGGHVLAFRGGAFIFVSDRLINGDRLLAELRRELAERVTAPDESAADLPAQSLP